MNITSRFAAAILFLLLLGNPEKTMSKRRRKSQQPNKPKKFKKDKVVAHMPVDKPNNAHMPKCMTAGCNRRVSDARKPRCPHCGGGSAYIDDYDMFNYGTNSQ
jgi:hypothetical protein